MSIELTIVTNVVVPEGFTLLEIIIDGKHCGYAIVGPMLARTFESMKDAIDFIGNMEPTPTLPSP